MEKKIDNSEDNYFQNEDLIDILIRLILWSNMSYINMSNNLLMIINPIYLCIKFK